MNSIRHIYLNVGTIPFYLMHLTPLLLIWTGITMFDVWLGIATFAIRNFFVTGVYHRYFAHNTYKLNRFWQFVFAFMAQTTAQKGALWWASQHIDHHKYSDTEQDAHSMARKGFWYSHVGWILDTKYVDTVWDNMKKYAKYPELVWLNKYYLVPPILMGYAIFALWGPSALVAGFLIPTVLLMHSTFTINSISHWRGSQRYKTGDESKNNVWLALLTFGEGWHNNHHYYQASCRLGFYWWEVDISWYILWLLSKIGIVKDIRNVPFEKRELDSKRNIPSKYNAKLKAANQAS